MKTQTFIQKLCKTDSTIGYSMLSQQIPTALRVNTALTSGTIQMIYLFLNVP